MTSVAGAACSEMVRPRRLLMSQIDKSMQTIGLYRVKKSSYI
jgi:hypothetical protein